eukprot:CAMPEP_0183718886 /NCGR_PEP_ID=MMETSP0737-20130205/12025_1 /TAXON_ID=385413 /ORGANISM="Thalassiosira miniscula, Strain CCMP1093" /LENGTH=259 /DNA_ID=CAMNT_0025948529 /DNA_START=54 /DNA_END=833 /DNA_ORIENTATION=-
MNTLLLIIGGQSILAVGASAFQCRIHGRRHASYSTSSANDGFGNIETQQWLSNKNDNNLWGGIVGLWDEVIEMSTYGPSERKMLKAQRERQKELSEKMNGEKKSETSIVGNDVASGALEFNVDDDDDQAWMEAFSAAKTKSDDSEDNGKLEYDGYALQDLLLSKWGVPLDADFQRIGKQLYCTVLPVVGYGGGKLRSRHDTELEYLMHLQGVVEILQKYDNLEEFVAFVETTDRVPKSGTDSVPFRLNLSSEDIERITA